jgi:glycosyltransferase involved in cell wall biosynthesis
VNSPNKVLFVSYSFPPDAEVGGKRIARFCRYLPEFGVAPAVLTVQERFYRRSDGSFAIPPGVEVIRTGALKNPLVWYEAVSRFRPAKNGQTAGRQSAFDDRGRSGFYETFRRNVLLAVQTPDRYWGWYWHAVRAGIAFVRRQGVPVIISSGPPWTSHLVARGIKRKTKVAWIADFRDPWTLNSWRRRLPNWLERFDQHLERTVVAETDRVVCTTDGIADNFRAKYHELPPEKFVTITNGIDGEYSVPTVNATNARRHLVHLGSLYGDRRLRPTLQAILQLISSSKLDPAAIRASFAGAIDQKVLDEAKTELSALQQLGVINLCGLLPYQEAQNMLASADLLLLIQGENRDAVPAKFYEYLVTRKPVLTLAKPGSLAQLIEETGLGACTDPDDPDAIAKGLLSCLESVPLPAADFERLIQRFHFRTLTGQLMEIIRQLNAALQNEQKTVALART